MNHLRLGLNVIGQNHVSLSNAHLDLGLVYAAFTMFWQRKKPTDIQAAISGEKKSFSAVFFGRNHSLLDQEENETCLPPF